MVEIVYSTFLHTLGKRVFLSIFSRSPNMNMTVEMHGAVVFCVLCDSSEPSSLMGWVHKIRHHLPSVRFGSSVSW